MYMIVADGNVIHYPPMFEEGNVALNPTVNLSANAHGSCSFTITKEHPYYEDITVRNTRVTVMDESEVLFSGRVISVERDFYGNKSVYCEGILAYLCDTLYRPYRWTGTAANFFRSLITEHNVYVDEDRQFTAGQVDTLSGSADWRSSDVPLTTWEAMSKLVTCCGGYLSLDPDKMTISWLSEDNYQHSNSQVIKFGENLLDLTDALDGSSVITCLRPYGAQLAEDDPGYVDPETVEGFWSGNRVTIDSGYVVNATGEALWGRIMGTATWDDTTSATQLQSQATSYLAGRIASTMSLTVSAVDLHLVDVDIERIHVGDVLQVYSVPHDLNLSLMCAAVDIDLANPDQSKITLGASAKLLTDLLT